MLGESYTPDDEEDSAAATVGSVWASQARYRVPLTKAVAGNWVLLEGVDATSELAGRSANHLKILHAGCGPKDVPARAAAVNLPSTTTASQLCSTALAMRLSRCSSLPWQHTWQLAVLE